MTYQELAHLVASKLTREELIALAEALDGDAGNDFCFFIQSETARVAHEMYIDSESISLPLDVPVFADNESGSHEIKKTK